GDGMPDIIAATGPGAPGQVRVFDGTSHRLIRQFYPFGRRYRGGLTIAAGLVDTDGNADLAVGNASGAVKVFSCADGSLLASFRVPGAAAAFRGGTGLRVADTHLNGLADVIVTTPRGSILRVVMGTTVTRSETARNLARLFSLGSIVQGLF